MMEWEASLCYTPSEGETSLQLLLPYTHSYSCKKGRFRVPAAGNCQTSLPLELYHMYFI